MLKLIRLNGEPLYVNYLQVLYVERIPETKVKLTTGDYYLVKNTLDDIEEQVRREMHEILTFKEKVKPENSDSAV